MVATFPGLPPSMFNTLITYSMCKLGGKAWGMVLDVWLICSQKIISFWRGVKAKGCHLPPRASIKPFFDKAGSRIIGIAAQKA